MNRKHIKVNPNGIYKCVICGKEFNGRWGRYKYCSKNCIRKNYLKEYRDKLQKPIELVRIINTNVKVNFLRLRFEIFKRDDFKCQYCGRTTKNDGCKLVIDHIIPKDKKGTNNPENLITSCEECNLGKGDILLEDRNIYRNIKKSLLIPPKEELGIF